MSTFGSASQPGNEQVAEQELKSEVEAFMMARAHALHEYGWSDETIAEALGIGEEVIEYFSADNGEY